MKKNGLPYYIGRPRKNKDERKMKERKKEEEGEEEKNHRTKI